MSNTAGKWQTVEQEARNVVQRHAEKLVHRLGLCSQDHDDIAQELWAGVWQALRAEKLPVLGPSWIECLVAAQAASFACRYSAGTHGRRKQEVPLSNLIELLPMADRPSQFKRDQMRIDTEQVLSLLDQDLRRLCIDWLTGSAHGAAVMPSFTPQQIETLRCAFTAAGIDPHT